ncbi:MAG: SusC/RagA family TonB-linked outer membrane protein, partial [Bacteroidales bacterium]|nr:SusC/RagA family TonB-linked outer membrane protein [Bacteroidales bacterium]
FTAALAANTTGLVINTSGQPGAAEVVRIRGTGSENAVNSPLYVIDGIPINMTDLTQMSTTGTNPMATLNPSDIASITVLKDAAAASLYGSRAANGVIIVTTKQGQEGKTKFNLDVQYGVANALYNKPMADKDQYAEKWVEGEMHRLMGMDAIFTGLSQIDYIKDTYANEGTYNYYQNAARNNFNRTYALNGVEYDFWGDGYDEYPNTNWYDHVSQQGGTRKINLSASGGQNGITFFTSGEYFEQIGTIKGSDLSRISGRLNLTSKTNKHVWFGVNMNMSYNNQNGPLLGNLFVNPLRAAANIPPVVPVYYDGEPNLSLAGGILNNYNPVAIREMNIYNSSGTRNITTAWAQFNFTKDLFLKTTFGYDNRPLYEIRWENPVVGTGAPLSGRRQDIETTRRRLSSSTILNYSKTIKEKHNLTALAGWESELTHTTELGAVATGYANSLTPILSTGTTPTETIGRTWDDALLSGFSQLQYNYDNKYYTQFSYRADGSSRFGEIGRWNGFYSISGSWRLSQEAFMDFAWLDDAKIRASFGTSGTLPSDLYGFLSNFTLGYDYYNLSGALINNIPNKNLSWESSENTNLGAEIKVLNGRIFASAEYYRRLTKDLLINKEISRTTGFTNALVNFGSIENKGFEYTLDAEVIRLKNLSWNVTLNLSTLNNLVLELPNDQVGPTNIDRVGYAEGSLYLPEYVGVDPSTGSPLWNHVDDLTGEITLTDNYAEATRQIIGTREPQKSGGISSLLKYKNFDLSVLFSFAWDFYTLDYAASRYTQTDGGQSYLNFETVQMDSWTPVDTLAANPIRINGLTNGGQFSTRHAYDGAYFKMKNIRLGYVIPQSISKKLMISSCRLFVQGENIFVLTDMPNFDPEVRVNGYRYVYDFPSPKMYTVGINLTF